MESSTELVSMPTCLALMSFVLWDAPASLFALGILNGSEGFPLMGCCQPLTYIIPSSSVAFLPISSAVSSEGSLLLWTQWNLSVLRFMLLHLILPSPATANPELHFTVFIVGLFWSENLGECDFTTILCMMGWVPVRAGPSVCKGVCLCGAQWITFNLIPRMTCICLAGFEAGFNTCQEFIR